MTSFEPDTGSSLIMTPCARSEIGNPERLFLAEHAVKKRRMEITGEVIAYMKTSFLLQISNIVELFFSKDLWDLGDRRSHRTPEHFEQQMFLFINSELWFYVVSMQYLGILYKLDISIVKKIICFKILMKMWVLVF